MEEMVSKEEVSALQKKADEFYAKQNKKFRFAIVGAIVTSVISMTIIGTTILKKGNDNTQDKDVFDADKYTTLAEEEKEMEKEFAKFLNRKTDFVFTVTDIKDVQLIQKNNLNLIKIETDVVQDIRKGTTKMSIVLEVSNEVFAKAKEYTKSCYKVSSPDDSLAFLKYSDDFANGLKDAFGTDKGTNVYSIYNYNTNKTILDNSATI